MDWFLPKYEATFQTISSEVDQSFQVGVELIFTELFLTSFRRKQKTLAFWLDFLWQKVHNVGVW